MQLIITIKSKRIYNTFITGVSMGGSLASKFVYTYNSDIEELEIMIRGIIPVYSGYWLGDKGIDN